MADTHEIAALEALAKDRADWLLDAVACSTQDRRFLRGDPAYDGIAGDSILLNGAKAITAAIDRAASSRILALEAQNQRLLDALSFYADISKYPAPLTGGQGALYFDCGQVARAAMKPGAAHA